MRSFCPVVIGTGPHIRDMQSGSTTTGSYSASCHKNLVIHRSVGMDICLQIRKPSKLEEFHKTKLLPHIHLF